MKNSKTSQVTKTIINRVADYFSVENRLMN